MSTSAKLTYLNDTKGMIKDAINKDFNLVTNDTTFREYADAINTINKAYNPFGDKIGYGENYCENAKEGNAKVAYKRGYLHQETTTGKNLIEPKMATYTLNDITCKNNGDGSFTINGTNTSSGTTAFRINQSTYNGTDNLQTYNGIYTLSCNELVSGIFVAIMQTGTWQSFSTISDSNKNQTTNFNNINNLYIYIGISGNKTINNVTLRPQLEKGSTATSYEPYTGKTASPNPEFPQQIEVYEGVENLYTINAEKLMSDSTGKIIANNYSYCTIVDLKNINKIYTKFDFTKFSDGAVRCCLSNDYPALNVTGSRKTLYVNEELDVLDYNYALFSYLPISGQTTEDFKNLLDNSEFIISKRNDSIYVPYKNDNYYNLFDGEIELGSINSTTGENVDNSSRKRSKNFIKVNPNTNYYFSYYTSANRWVIGYDENKNVITNGGVDGYASILFKGTGTGGTFKTSSTTKYIRWYDTNSTDLTEIVTLQEGTEPIPYHTNYAVVKNSGKNLFDKDNFVQVSLYPTTTTFSSSSSYKSILFEIKPNTTYTFTSKNHYSDTLVAGTSVNYPIADGNLTIRVSGSKTKDNITITSGANDKYLVVYVKWQGSITEEIANGIMLKENTAQTSYEPYREPTITRISLNNNFLAKIGDVKDEVDFVSGTLIKRIGKVVLDGSESWQQASTNVSGKYRYLNGTIMQQFITKNAYSTHFVNVDDSFSSNGLHLASNGTSLWLRDDDTFTNLAQFKEWLSQNKPEIYYTLAKPQIIQLNPTQIKMFNGVNILELENDAENSFDVTYIKSSDEGTSNIYDANKATNITPSFQSLVDKPVIMSPYDDVNIIESSESLQDDNIDEETEVIDTTEETEVIDTTEETETTEISEELDVATIDTTEEI